MKLEKSLIVPNTELPGLPDFLFLCLQAISDPVLSKTSFRNPAHVWRCYYDFLLLLNGRLPYPLAKIFLPNFCMFY